MNIDIIINIIAIINENIKPIAIVISSSFISFGNITFADVNVEYQIYKITNQILLIFNFFI